MHATKLASVGIKYLGDLDFVDLCQLQIELDASWKSGQSTVSNTLYDKVTDGRNHELTQLKNDPYLFGVKRTDSELKKLADYLNQLYSQGIALVDNSVWDILHRELAMRQAMPTTHSLVSYPSYWTTMSLEELPIQFISLSRSSSEYREMAEFFVRSLAKPKTVVYSITRIQNLRLWSIFQELQKTIPNAIQRLIHGTASAAHQKLVMHHGFQHSFCPGGSIGDGVYFAVNAHYSNNDPYVLKKTSHRRELFICQVLLGNSSQGGWGVKSPAHGCHSVFMSEGNTNPMFCIFNGYQAYPEYIVQYDYEWNLERSN